MFPTAKKFLTAIHRRSLRDRHEKDRQTDDFKFLKTIHSSSQTNFVSLNTLNRGTISSRQIKSDRGADILH